VDLQVPITITDELTEEIVNGRGMLDLASGEIHRVEYAEWDVGTRGLPADHEEYEFTVGTLSNDGKDVEFRVDVDVMRARYFVSPSELLELKVRAAKLFAGLEGKALLDSAQRVATEHTEPKKEGTAPAPKRHLH